MKTFKLTIRIEITAEEYAQMKALEKCGWSNVGAYMYLGSQGIISRFYEDEEDQDEETKAEAKIYLKEYDRIMKKLSKVK